MEVGVCDFCAAPNPVWAYLSADFVLVEQTGHGSAGSWAACHDCREVIELSGLEGIIKRSTRRYLEERAEEHAALNRDQRRRVRAEVERALRNMYVEFFTAKSDGPPVLISEIAESCEHEDTILSVYGENSWFLPTGYYCTTCGTCIALASDGELVPPIRIDI